MLFRSIALAVIAIAFVATGIWWFMGQRSHVQALTLYGNVDIRQISLAFEGSGRVTELRVNEGDHVKAGDLLGVLDTRTLALQADQAQAQVAVQQQTLARLRNGSRPQEISQARSRMVSAEADALRAEQDLARLQGIASPLIKEVRGRGLFVGVEAGTREAGRASEFEQVLDQLRR